MLKAAYDPYEQAEFIVRRIKDLQENKSSLKDIAVLFRAAHHSAELQLTLSKNNIPFVVRSGLKFFDSAHIKDIIAFLKVWQNIDDELSWNRILKMLPHIGTKTAEKLYKNIKGTTLIGEVVALDLALSYKQNSSWERYKDIFQYLTDLSTGSKGFISDGLTFILKAFYKEYLKASFDDSFTMAQIMDMLQM